MARVSGIASHALHSIVIERHEAKYVLHPSMVPKIRAFIAPFCTPDPHAKGFPPEYDILTLQLDSPDLALHHAKEYEAVDRFKLRCRTYGVDDRFPVFTEIKRKTKGIINKSRALVPKSKWCEDLILNPYHVIDFNFKSEKEEVAFLEFVRVTREIGASPVVLIKYTRESYMSRMDTYARVTFDRKLMYQSTDSWTDWGRGGIWRPIDTGLIQNKEHPYSGVVLELKTTNDMPIWMEELIQNFDLVRSGHCKYSNAVYQEGIFCGVTSAPTYATDVMLF